MATRWVGTSAREKPNALSCLDHPEDGDGQRWVSYTRGQCGVVSCESDVLARDRAQIPVCFSRF